MLRPAAKLDSTASVDNYLGFTISPVGTGFLALPDGWPCDEPIWESDVPSLRKRIWRWWHQVQPSLPKWA